MKNHKNCTIWKKKYSPAPRILWQFCTPPDPSTLKRKSFWGHFWVCAECLNYINATPQLPQRCRFFRGRVKTSKNNSQVYRWPQKRSLCCGFVLVSFFRKSTKRWPRLDFWGVKNASKSDENYELWRAPRTIRRLGSSARTDPKIVQKWLKTLPNPT